jgi:hypothetical protein
MAIPKLKVVFRGTYSFGFNLPEAEWNGIVEMPEFEAVRTFNRLELMRDDDAPDFLYAQAVCVTGVEDHGFRDGDFDSVLVHSDAVRWVLCFPVRKLKTRYALQTRAVSLDGENVFYFFTGDTLNGTPIRAVPDLDRLRCLSPRPGAQLALVRAKNWRWDEKRDTVSIRPQDVLEMEIVLDSEVRVLWRPPNPTTRAPSLHWSGVP